MNYSFTSLSIKRNVDSSPFITFSGKICLSKISFAFCSSPFLIPPKYTKIFRSSFTYLTNPIVLQSKSHSNFKCVCSCFANITATTKGCVFNLENSVIDVLQCTFINLSTTNISTCFSATKSSLHIRNCIFLFCKAKSGNDNYGNAFFTEKSTNKIERISCQYCAQNEEDSGDSSIVLYQALSTIFIESNATNNFGKQGASLLSYLYSSAEDNILRFVNVMGGKEYCAVESYETSATTISYGNFINTSDYSKSTIHNSNAEATMLNNCAFIFPTQTIFSNVIICTFINCISTLVPPGYENITITDQNARVSFHFQIELVCATCHNNKFRFNNALFSSFMLLSLYTNQ